MVDRIPNSAPQPMTDRRLEWYQCHKGGNECWHGHHIRELLAEIDRLRNVNEQLRESLVKEAARTARLDERVAELEGKVERLTTPQSVDPMFKITDDTEGGA